MLDDLRKIHERDRDDALGIIAGSYRQLQANLPVTAGCTWDDISNIVVAGMGGSALAAMMFPEGLKVGVPLEIVRGYEVPAYSNRKTLFIASSYSGDTEETIEALYKAEERGVRVIVIASGGELVQRAKEKGYPYVLLPDLRQGRFATFYSLNAFVTLFASLGIPTVAQDEMNESANFLHRESEAWLPTVPAKENLAKQIALECMGKSVVVYAGTKLASAAYAWKLSINENAKQVAWWNVLPEFNHNEFTGWSKQPIEKPYEVIELRSTLEHPRIQRRFEETERLLSGKRPAPFVVETQGDTVLKQLVWSVALGNFVGVYLAMLNGLDPSSLDLVDKLKRALKDYTAATIEE